MRKFLMVAAVGLLALAVAAPATALDFKFSSSNRFRLYSLDGIGAEGATVAVSPFAETTTNNANQADARFRPYFIVQDDNGKIQSHVRFEIGDVVFGSTTASPGGGSGGGLGADGVNVETKWAFVDAALPFGIPGRIRGGIQGYFLPKSLLIDDDGSGIRIYGEVKPVKYDFWWLAITDVANAGTVATGLAAPSATAGPAADDNHAFALKLDVPLTPWLNPYIYGVYRHGTETATDGGGNKSTESMDGGWIGVGTVGKVGNVSYDLDFVYGQDGRFTGDAAGFEDRRGWVLDGGVEIPFGPTDVGLRFMYATGDKTETTDKVEDFPGIRSGGTITAPAERGSYTPKGGELFWASAGNPLFGAFTYQADPHNTWTIGGYVSYKPVKALTLKLDYFYIGATEKNSNFYTGKSTIGNEVALTATYTFWTGTKAWLLAGAIITPNNGREPTTGAAVGLKHAQAYAFGVQHDF